jgi:hypothetical protein
MALTPGEGDGGAGGLGGTAGSICAISPSDLVGTIGNLISRIEDLEFALSQVLGANLHANTLGDISSQVGWVYNVEYMGVPGWIQTEYGTLIPPPGFTILGSGMTLSDGNTYSAVLMDSDGVLQYGFTTGGQITGNAALGSTYGIWSSGGSHGGTNADPDQIYFKDVTVLSSTLSTAVSSTPVTRTASWRVNSSGMYMISMAGMVRLTGTTGIPLATMIMSVLANTSSNQLSYEVSSYWEQINSFNLTTNSFTVPARFYAGDVVTFSYTGTHVAPLGPATVANYHLNNIYVSLVKVGSLT